MPTDEEIVEETRRTALDLAMPLFNYHLACLHRMMALKVRSGSMLYWGSLRTVFRGHPGAEGILDALRPELMAMPIDEPSPPTKVKT